MNILIRGRHLAISEALKAYARDKVEHIQKFVDRPSEAHVVLYVDHLEHHADINLKAGQFHLRGQAKSEDMYASIDLACDKIERQLKKYKDRLKNHRPAHVHAREPVRVRYEIFAASPLDGLPAELMRSDEFLAKPMSVEEAIMQMDLLNNDFLMFTNDKTGDVNLVYRRKDGHFGLIEAHTSAAVPAKKSKASEARS